MSLPSEALINPAEVTRAPKRNEECWNPPVLEMTRECQLEGRGRCERIFSGERAHFLIETKSPFCECRFRSRVSRFNHALSKEEHSRSDQTHITIC